MEYIHFLDSDDMLSLDCIERCVESIGEADILWHDHCVLSEINTPIHDDFPLLETLHLSKKEVQEGYFTALDLWAENFEGLSWAWCGIFKLSSLQDLRFLPQVVFEDTHFGTLLFAKAQRIKICDFIGYIYRYRHHSIRVFDDVFEKSKQPKYFWDICQSFERMEDILFYRWSYSYTHICLEIVRFIRTLDEDSTPLKNRLENMLYACSFYGFEALTYSADPKHIRDFLQPLKPYAKRVSLRGKLAYYTPRLFRILRVLNQTLKRILPRSK